MIPAILMIVASAVVGANLWYRYHSGESIHVAGATLCAVAGLWCLCSFWREVDRIAAAELEYRNHGIDGSARPVNAELVGRSYHDAA